LARMDGQGVEPWTDGDLVVRREIRLIGHGDEASDRA
jgi:hypothetical protein